MRRRIYLVAIILIGSFYVSSCSTENTDVFMRAKEQKNGEISEEIIFGSSEKFPTGTHFQLSEKPNLSLVKISQFCDFKSKEDRNELNKMLPELSRLKGVEHEIRSVWFAWNEVTITAKIQMGDHHDVFLVKDLKTNKWEIVYVIEGCY